MSDQHDITASASRAAGPGEGIRPPAGTGVPGVDDAIARLELIEASPLAEHPDIYDDVQRRLQQSLAEFDDDPAGEQ